MTFWRGIKRKEKLKNVVIIYTNNNEHTNIKKAFIFNKIYLLHNLRKNRGKQNNPESLHLQIF